MVAAAIRTIFAQPDATHVREQLDVIAGMLGRQFPKLEVMPHLDKPWKGSSKGAV
jgi:putative transposase